MNGPRRPRWQTEEVPVVTQPAPSRMQSIRTVMEGLTVSGVGAVFVLLWGLQGSQNDLSRQVVKLQTQLEVMQQGNNSAQAALPGLTSTTIELKMLVAENQRRILELEARVKEEGRHK